ncbi:MAG: endolytic transglycosylase MltG [Methylococcales bacterium]|nr:endolytic transglycosylase MltG [Methylococcales bacterium]
MKIFVNILAFLSFAFIAVAIFGWVTYHKENLRIVVIESQSFEIKKGDSVTQIIQNLQKQKVDINPLWFKIIGYSQQSIHTLKAGEYTLKKNLTTRELLALLTSGKSRQYSITFPEGWAFKQMLKKISETPNLQQTLAGVDNETLMSRLGADYKHPEGLFFPDTYFFNKNSSDFSILQKAYDKMQRVLQQQWDNKEKDLVIKTPYETLILASIIEKETAAMSERTLISGVFSRRLQKRMLLQTDPTVIYGMGDHYQGNIRRKDLREATPYNTYVIKGLPPTPIAMPGKAAIHAALHPAKGKSLYFVSRGDGTHVFSATLKDHNNAVNTYQRNPQ